MITLRMHAFQLYIIVCTNTVSEGYSPFCFKLVLLSMSNREHLGKCVTISCSLTLRPLSSKKLNNSYIQYHYNKLAARLNYAMQLAK